jgi:3-dehydroquinate dehydratase/shikimate dehydrogenase
MVDLAAVADMFEIRADLVLDLDLLTLLRARTRPLLFTCRSVSQGGRWADDDPARRLALLEAVKRGFDYVDVEYASGLLDVMIEKAGRGLVVSHHDMEGLPEDLEGLYARMCECGADIVKIAVTPRSIADVGRLLAFARRTARAGGPPLVPIAMGPLGLVSRIVCGRYGAPFTFAYAEGGYAAAPGQLPVRQMLDLYRVGRVSPSTRVYGVLGSQVGRSLSPYLHNRAFAACNLDAVYVPLQAESLAGFLAALPALDLAGFSVTRPYKVDIVQCLDALAEPAARCGSVNTVSCEGQRLRGTTTDGPAVVALLRKRTEIKKRAAVIIGAGGAARAAAAALRGAGARVTLVARDVEKASVAAAETVCAHGALADLGRYPWDILINATPVGSSERPDETPVPAELHRPGTIVFDMVYDPLETRLLREAQAAGCTIVDGLEMLLAQAALQFEFWTGAPAPMDAMKSAALAIAQEQV